MKYPVGFVVGAAGLAFGMAATPAVAGPDWQENGDAGKFISGAQATLGVGAIRSISGSFSEGLTDPDYEDVYLIRIEDPATFRLQITTSVGTVGLFLFNVTQANEGFGLLGSIDGPGEGNEAVITPVSNDGTLAQVVNPGVYALAIAVPGWRPWSRTGAIYSFTNPNEISGPDGAGGLNPLDSWQGQTGPVGEYGLDLTGCGFVAVPAPGSVLLTGAGLVLVGRRRRV